MLNPKKQASLECLLEANKQIALAHAMKEQMRLFWSKVTVKEGVRFGFLLSLSYGLYLSWPPQC